jgi:hypothetical protein
MSASTETSAETNEKSTDQDSKEENEIDRILAATREASMKQIEKFLGDKEGEVND